ncbi:peptidylprolyl isomerase [Candidatus Poribacteria bacterium]|nr:peptidylprolyl isomerase [Candidatus Poribacteria bacterium]
MLRLRKTNQFRRALLILTALFVVFLSSCAQQDKKTTESDTQTDTSDTQTETETVVEQTEEPEKKEPEPQIDPAKAIAVIETAKGNIEFEFYATDAPNTSKHFIKNASKGFYRNEPFHRVEDLIIQAGSTFANETLPIEKSDKPLEKGVVLMAKEEGANVSDGDEFFICKDAIALDDDYTTLGKVIKGLDVLDKIVQDDKIVNITIRERSEEE